MPGVGGRSSDWGLWAMGVGASGARALGVTAGETLAELRDAARGTTPVTRLGMGVAMATRMASTVEQHEAGEGDDFHGDGDGGCGGD